MPQRASSSPKAKTTSKQAPFYDENTNVGYHKTRFAFIGSSRRHSLLQEEQPTQEQEIVEEQHGKDEYGKMVSPASNPSSPSSPSSPTLPSHPLTRSPTTTSKSICEHYRVLLDNGMNEIIIQEYQYVQRFTVHNTWLFQNHVIHLAHGKMFGTRRIWVDDEVIVDVSKLLDDGSSHAIKIGERDARVIIRAAHGKFSYHLTIDGHEMQKMGDEHHSEFAAVL